MDTTILEQVSKLTLEEQQAVENFIQELLSKHSVTEVESIAEKRKKNMGWAKGTIWMADDFNETPEDFKDYL
jgi:Protein of unknown function (DUF2281)